jgi:DNA-binding response OmpR family regulator
MRRPAAQPQYPAMTIHTAMYGQGLTTTDGLSLAAWDYVEYDWVSARLFRRRGRTRHEVVGITPLTHRLVRYMAARSRECGGVAVACTHAELVNAVWGDAYGYTAANLRDLVAELRKRLEPERPRGAPSKLLETVSGIGYRLVVRATAAADTGTAV